MILGNFQEGSEGVWGIVRGFRGRWGNFRDFQKGSEGILGIFRGFGGISGIFARILRDLWGS